MMAIMIKCKMCGGDLNIIEGASTAECEYCGSVQTIPNLDDEKKLLQFERAERLRKQCEFDKAAGIYESIVADFRQEAEAYWGLVLCKYGIEYVDDPATGKKIPTCHRSSFNSIMADADFEQTLENADSAARKVYREEAKAIEEIRKGIIAVSANEEPYDIFICYKETDEKGERTLDSVLAQDVYDALTDKGYRVFFSRISLEDKLGREYEPCIFAALNSAKIMLAFGTDYEYFNAVWVKNEWSRYLKMMETDKAKHLIPCYKGIDAYDMPKEFAKLQAQDLGKVGAVQDLLRGIDKLISPTASVTVSAVADGAKLAELLSMGNEALEHGEWDMATSRFDLALVADPKCADAYLGKLMAERKCKKREDLGKTKKKLSKNIFYKQAIAYADDALKQELEGYNNETIKHARRVTIALLIAALCAVMLLFAGIELSFNLVIRNYVTGKSDAESTYQQLSELSWYKEPDGYTQLLLYREIGVYPDAIYATEVNIPEGVTEIKGDMFLHCYHLQSVTIPKGVTSIGYSAFSGCISLTEIVIPEGVTSIGYSAFSGCTRLTEILIPEGVTSIDYSAFSGCTSLTEIVIPEGVTSIGYCAFSDCTSLTSITIPDSLTAIGSFAFRGCTDLQTVYFHSEAQKEKYQSRFPDCTLIVLGN